MCAVNLLLVTIMFARVCFVVFAACSLQVTRPASVTKNNNINPQIVFPGPVKELNTRFGAPNDTDPCEGETYCAIKPDNYPEDFFNNFFKQKIKEPVFQPTYVLTELRAGESEEVDNCDARITYEPLYTVRTDKLSDWRFVAQAPKQNFHQMVRIEKCKKSGGSCFTKFKAPIDLETSCMQKYGVWEFLIYDGKNGTEKLKIDLPSCCSCYYRTKD